MEDDLRCNESVLSAHTVSPVEQPSNYVEYSSVPCLYDESFFSDKRVVKNLLNEERIQRELLLKNRVTPEDVTDEMKDVTLNWMLEICDHLQCEDQVFVVASAIMERFLSSTQVQRTQIQLTGSVCLLLASKLRTSTHFSVRELAFYTGDSVTVEEILQWEVLILAKLGWDINLVTSVDFIEHVFKQLPELQNGDVARRHAFTYATFTAMNHVFNSLLPSELAAGCICVALKPYSSTLPNYPLLISSALNCTLSTLVSTKHMIEQHVRSFRARLGYNDGEDSFDTNLTSDESPFLCQANLNISDDYNNNADAVKMTHLKAAPLEIHGIKV